MKAYERRLKRKAQMKQDTAKAEYIWTRAMSPILKGMNKENIDRFTNVMQSKDKAGGTVI